MLRIILATVLGGVVLFVWGNVSWMMLPWRNDVMVELPAQQVVLDALGGGEAEEAVYVYPMWPKTFGDEAAMKEYEAKLAAGPVFSGTFRRAGDDSMYDNMAIGFGLNLGMALIASMLLLTAVRGHCNFIERWLFVGTLGLFVGVGADMIAWNWMYTPTKFMLINVADHVIGALLMGFVLALVIRPKRADAAE